MAKRSKSSKDRLSPAWRLLGRLMLWAVVAAVVAGAGYVGATSAWRAVSRRPEFQFNPQQFRLSTAPAWVDADALSRELRAELSALPERTSIFEHAAAAAVFHELSSSPWLEEVVAVRRQLPNRLSIQATFRKPMGLARWEQRKIMVDRHGYPLPDSLFRAPPEWHGVRMPIIADRLLSSPPPVGRPWDEPRIALGARLTDFLLRNGVLGELHLATIDVTGVDRGSSEPDIVLTTARGTQIKWGASSLYPEVGLPAPAFLTSDAEKLQMLLAKLSDYPHLRGVEYVDLRFHGKVYFRESESVASPQ